MGVDLMGGHCLEGVDPGFSKGGGGLVHGIGEGVSPILCKPYTVLLCKALKTLFFSLDSSKKKALKRVKPMKVLDCIGRHSCWIKLCPTGQYSLVNIIHLTLFTSE